MADLNYSNSTLRREDWKHTVNTLPQKTARKIQPSAIREKPVDFDYTPAVKPEVHPLKMPANLMPAQADWTGGREYYDRVQGNVRLVSSAEVDELVAWGLPKIQLRYPRATAQAIIPFLRNACRGGQVRFLRTDNGCGLFQIVQTPWEPLPIVEEVFVIVREPQMNAKDARRIYSAARTWADEIKAVAFEYGGSTGVDITPIARKIGYEHRRYEFIKRLDNNVPSSRR